MRALVNKYLEGKASDEELHQLKGWLDEEGNQAVFKQMKLEWKKDLKNENLPDSTLRELDRFQSKMLIENASKIKRLNFLQNFYKYAAVIFFALMLGGGLFFFDKGEVIYNEVVAEDGQLSKVILPDSTQIWLNSGSSVRYSNEFGLKDRNVKLTGQAFLDVTKNKDLPFILNCGAISVKVLGTRFSVESYEEDPNINVVLEEGAIDLLSTTSGKTFAHLKPNELAVYDKSERAYKIDEVVAQKYTAWRDGIIHFYDQPLEEVALKLQRRYNQPIEVDESVRNYKVTFSIKNEDFDKVMEILKAITPATVSQEAGVVYMKHK
ncbi:FecR family protein [Mangrovibacterium diazotrophicum]|uniref:FecR family protein n=1 Tax=Mangrovibacterium diazotrophicum TaxID=1261403 RepID=A0A419W4H1_9BACT|nr:FecR domain-containing protein [Mangrovibacterium diazotrophicum]RKD90347.1 FecR family protein [Mangrovibacterium diazotrophicum]